MELSRRGIETQNLILRKGLELDKILAGSQAELQEKVAVANSFASVAKAFGFAFATKNKFLSKSGSANAGASGQVSEVGFVDPGGFSTSGFTA